jgi:TorA maturation chaperone TorD
MTEPIIAAFRILGHFWLEEIKPDDLETITALRELAQTLPNTNLATLTDLAVEYQRLFGFNLPPYESIFADPSAMLMAPATERVRALYQQGGWQLPRGIQIGVPDHLGAELLALADWLAAGRTDLAHHLYGRHLALWAPVFVITLRRLTPHPFYNILGDLTLDLLLTTLPEEAVPINSDPFPDLPPPPIYRGTYDRATDLPDSENLGGPRQSEGSEEEAITLHNLISQLLPPRQAGIFLTREDIALISRRLHLPIGLGERFRMLDSLFRAAGQYDLIPDLFDQLNQKLLAANAAYQHLTDEYMVWKPYADAWGQRLSVTKANLEMFKQSVIIFG